VTDCRDRERMRWCRVFSPEHFPSLQLSVAKGVQGLQAVKKMDEGWG